MSAIFEQIEDARAELCRRHPLVARMDQLLRQRFIKFMLVGAINTLFGYLVFLASLWLTGHSFLSLGASWFIGIAFNFRTTGQLVFGSSDRRLLGRFLGVYGVAFTINAGLLRLLEWAGVSSAVAAFILTPLVAVLTFLLLREFVFFASGSKGHAA